MEVSRPPAQSNSKEQILKAREEILQAVDEIETRISYYTKVKISLSKEIDRLLKDYRDLLPIKIGDKVKVTTLYPHKKPLERIGYVTEIDVRNQPPIYYVLWANKDGSRPFTDITHRYIVFEGTPRESIERVQD